ncbi:MAG: hypothetical protein J5666_08045 [Bacilli bacterium]|nr:hypothetical protein [Bacilli bacterium]
MEHYEKNISLKTIYLTFVRRFKLILFLFVPIALGSVVVTQFVMTKTYASSSVVSKTAVFNASHYQTLKLSFSSNDLLTNVKAKLDEQNIKHSNGNEITVSEISSGLSFSALNTNDVSVTVSYQSTDKSITQPVLKELVTLGVNGLKENGDFKTLSITTEATEGVKNSKNGKQLLIGIAAGVVVALGLPFVYEIISDEVYDKKDVEMLGCASYEI